MIDIVFSEIEPPSLELDWKTAMRRRAVSTREALNRHRWAVGHMEGRTTTGRRTCGSTTRCSGACAPPASRSR